MRTYKVFSYLNGRFGGAFLYAAQKTCGALGGRARHAAQDTQSYGQSRALRRTAVRGMRRLSEAAGPGAVQGRAVFVRCVLRWQRGRNERARARRNRARTRARGRTMDFCGRRWAQARARCKGAGTRAHCGFYEAGEGKGAGAQWIFCGGRGHGHTAGLFAAGAGAWAHRGSARRGIAAHSGRAHALAPGGFFPCGKKITRRQAR